MRIDTDGIKIKGYSHAISMHFNALSLLNKRVMKLMDKNHNNGRENCYNIYVHTENRAIFKPLITTG